MNRKSFRITGRDICVDSGMKMRDMSKSYIELVKHK